MERASWMALAGMALVTTVALALAWRTDQENRLLRVEVESMQARVDAMERMQARALRGGGPVRQRAGQGWMARGAAAGEGDEGASGEASGEAAGDLAGDGAAGDAAASARLAELRDERWERRREVVLDAAEEITARRGYDADTSQALLALVERSVDDTRALRGARQAGEVDPAAARDELLAARQQVEDEVIALLGEEEGDAFLQALRDARAASVLGAREPVAP